MLVWKLAPYCTFIHLFIQGPRHAGHCSVARDTKINKERSLPPRLSQLNKGDQVNKGYSIRRAGTDVGKNWGP